MRIPSRAPGYTPQNPRRRIMNRPLTITNGRAIALALSSAGATVVCADLNKKARKEGYEEDIEIDTDDVIQHRGGKAVYVQADVRYASEVENLVTRTVSDFGRLDIMVNNAGVGTGLNTISPPSSDEPGITPTVLRKLR
jgi:NAD(P)-dependent dehydrogenase (short-subunit alcohol dehydrogenase family)